MERKNAFSDNQKVNFEVEGDTGFVLMYVSELHFKRKIEFSDTNLRSENLADVQVKHSVAKNVGQQGFPSLSWYQRSLFFIYAGAN